MLFALVGGSCRPSDLPPPGRGDGILNSQMAKWCSDAEVVAALRETAIVAREPKVFLGKLSVEAT